MKKCPLGVLTFPLAPRYVDGLLLSHRSCSGRIPKNEPRDACQRPGLMVRLVGVEHG